MPSLSTSVSVDDETMPEQGGGYAAAREAIYVDDAFQDHLGWKSEIPIPQNFKHPERCRVIWNVPAQKKEWRQYIGSGFTCVPELKENNVGDESTDGGGAAASAGDEE